MYRYDNLYVDFSYTMYNDEYNRELKNLIYDNSLLRSRVLFGSDYYMLVREGHYRDLFADFRTRMGDDIMKQIAFDNTRAYLFD